LPITEQDWDLSVAELKNHLRSLESPQRSLNTTSR
jgi:hypothetical protein